MTNETGMKCAIPYQMMHHGHVNMINHRDRNKFFLEALQKTAQDKVVLDVGTGTGLLSAYALKAGARFVYAVEKEEQYANIAQTVLSGLFDQDRFKVIHGDFWTDVIDDKIPPNSVDIMVSETVGPALFEEGMTISWHCAKPFLKSDAICIPDRLHIDALGYHGIYRPSMINIYDLDLTTEKNHHEDLYADNLMFPEFYDQIQKYVVRHYDCHGWMDLQGARKPDWVIKDAYSVTKDTIPPTLFSDLPYPLHIQAQVEFELDIPGPCTVALIGHISFGDSTLTVNGSCYQCSPAVKFTRAGRYKFSVNPERPIATNNIWLIEELETKENL